MIRVAKCRKGICTAVITLILLVISILLALIAALYAVNMSGLQEENLSVYEHHIWYNSTGDWWEAGFVVTNTGGRDVVFDKITFRGQPCEWSNVYYWKTNNVTVIELNVTSSQLSGTSCNIMVQDELRNFTRASDDLTLKSGWKIVLFIKNPVSEWMDGWATLKVHTANRPYPKLCKLEAV